MASDHFPDYVAEVLAQLTPADMDAATQGVFSHPGMEVGPGDSDSDSDDGGLPAEERTGLADLAAYSMV